MKVCGLDVGDGVWWISRDELHGVPLSAVSLWTEHPIRINGAAGAYWVGADGLLEGHVGMVMASALAATRFAVPDDALQLVRVGVST
jgi:hypothetical protein